MHLPYRYEKHSNWGAFFLDTNDERRSDGGTEGRSRYKVTERRSDLSVKIANYEL